MLHLGHTKDYLDLGLNKMDKAMAPHSSTLAWKIPQTEEPGRLQSMGSQRVGHDWATSLSLFTFMHWRRKRQPTPVVLPGESQGRGAWWAAVYGVAQSRLALRPAGVRLIWQFCIVLAFVFLQESINRLKWYHQVPSNFRFIHMYWLMVKNGFP